MKQTLALLATALLASGSQRALGAEATLDNGKVRVVAHLETGTYDITDAATGQTEIAQANFRMGEWVSTDSGLQRTARTEPFTDELGKGQTLHILCHGENRPDLLLDISLYDGETQVVLRAGLANTGKEPVRIMRYRPLADSRVLPRRKLAEPLTLTAPSSCNQPVASRSPYATSANNLLLTGKIDGQRHSLVMGALKTAEFTKHAVTAPPDGLDARCLQLATAIPGAKLAAYQPCTRNAMSSPANGPMIRQARGSCHAFASQLPQTAVHFDGESLNYSLEGLDPKKHYAVGFSWWDFDANGRIGSVAAVDAKGTVYPLVSARPLPQFTGKGQPPSETAALLPAAATTSGRMILKIANETPKAANINIVASEIWLWELPADATLPAEWTAGKPVEQVPPAKPDGSETMAILEANDPLGRLVDPGETWLPADSFYLDFGVADPYAALEKYALKLRAATGADQRHAYTFPTICAWYAGVWKTKGSQDHPEKSTYRINTTAGLVEEAKVIEKSGFLRYSQVAGRLVPDNYTPDNPQGWWDDAHWRQHGLYTAPYETSRKFGQGMHDNGCLAFTYIQPTCGWAGTLVSRDFRQLHPDWLRAGDPKSALDYSNPAVQQHLVRSFGELRGNIDGFMVDYCDDFWNFEACGGGFADPKTTSTAFYRMFFRKIREGIGPDARIHERNLEHPNNDLTLGIVDSQRTETDTDRISPLLLSRSALRWYKNRVVLAYDMDSKELNSSWKIDGWRGSDQDGRRMLLTMAYVAASRLLTANSFRDLSAETIHDLSRTFPYPTALKSARPIDAFTRPGTCPRVYDYAVTPAWHQVTLFNTTLPSREETLTVPLAGEQIDGALGLDPAKEYYAYDFWNNRLAGRFKGTDTLTQTLRPGEARMLAIHAVEPNPQFLSTDRHVMQGLLDLPQLPAWDAKTKTLAGTATVAAHETFRITLALNGHRATTAGPGCKIETTADPNQIILAIDNPKTATTGWWVRFE